MNRNPYRGAGGWLAGLLALVAACPALAADAPKTPLPSGRTPITNVVFVAFDTETTGFDPVQDRVVEIGAVKFIGGAVVEQKSWLVNPGRTIPYWAKRVHGITDEMVADQPSFADAYPEFAEFIAGAVLLAHNARFDIAFINAEARRNHLAAPPNEVIDSLPLFRKWFPDSSKYSLEGLSQYLNIEDKGFHRAVADSMYIYWILELGLEQRGPLQTLGELEKDAGGAMRF